MRISAKIILAAGFGAALLQLPARAEDKPAFKDDREKASYGVGFFFGNQLKSGHLDVDLDVVLSTMKDVLADKELKMNQQQAREAVMSYQQALTAKLAEQNKKAAEAFFLENKSKEGVKVVTVPTGKDATADLQYKVLVQGTNEVPGSNDIVTINIHTTTLANKEVENLTNRKFPVGRCPVRGLSSVLPLMNVGSKYVVYLPSALAYGDGGRPGVDPGAAVISEVELVSTEAPPPPAPPTAPAQPLTSDIIKVPSAEELKKGAKIEVIKSEDVARQAQELTNKPAAK
jgi:FKBP-type peptidyl-prolyl cis-trans isomerase